MCTLGEAECHHFAIGEIIRREGVLNTALLKLGLIQAPLDIMFTPTAVLIGMAYVYLPLMVLPLYAAVERFDMRGERDFGAHALPVALRGDVRSTRATLDPLRELVEGRGLDTAPIYAQLDELDRLADEMDAKYDVAYSEWEQQDRLRLQAEVARANELLAPVATMTVIRRMN